MTSSSRKIEAFKEIIRQIYFLLFQYSGFLCKFITAMIRISFSEMR